MLNVPLLQIDCKELCCQPGKKSAASKVSKIRGCDPSECGKRTKHIALLGFERDDDTGTRIVRSICTKLASGVISAPLAGCSKSVNQFV